MGQGTFIARTCETINESEQQLITLDKRRAAVDSR